MLSPKSEGKQPTLYAEVSKLSSRMVCDAALARAKSYLKLVRSHVRLAQRICDKSGMLHVLHVQRQYQVQPQPHPVIQVAVLDPRLAVHLVRRQQARIHQRVCGAPAFIAAIIVVQQRGLRGILRGDAFDLLPEGVT